MPTWPETLPQKPLQEGFEEVAPDLALRTQMDAGPAKTRKRFTAAPRKFTINLDLTGDEVDILDAFYLDDCAGGAVSFDWEHPRTEETAYFRIVTPPAYRPAGGLHWTASLNLELMP